MHLEAPVGKGIGIIISTAPPQPAVEPILWGDGKSFVPLQRMDDSCYIALYDDANGCTMTAVFKRKDHEKLIKLLYENVKHDELNCKNEKKLMLIKAIKKKEESK